VRIPVTVDASGFAADLRDAVLDGMRQAQASMAANPLDIPVRVQPNTFDFARELLDDLRDMERSGLFRMSVPVDVRFDQAQALADFEALRRALQEAARPIRQEVDVDVDRGIAGLGRMDSSMRRVLLAAGLLGGGGAAGIAAIGGAAAVAAGAVGGLVVGAAALGPAIAAAAGTATVALSGMKDAFDAAADAAEKGPEEAAASARAIASAQNSLESALDGATSAQESYTDAVRDQDEANRDVADSYRLQAEDLEDLQLKLRGSVLSQKEAALSLEQAQKAVGKAKTYDEYREALVRVERAQLNLDEAVERGKDVAEEAATAQEKGIENGDRVVAAKDRAAEADKRVQAAARQSEAAQRAVAQAQAAVAEAQSAGTPSAEAYAKAMAKLAPSAREFVLAARDLKPLTEGLGDAVQQEAFEGLGATLTDLGVRVLPVVQEGMVGVAGEMNNAADSFLNFIGSARGLEGLRSVFAGTSNLLAGMQAGTGGFTQGMLDLVAVAEPAMFGLGQAFASIGGEIGKAFTAAADSGLLSSMFEGLTQALTGVGPLLGSLVTSLITIVDRVLPSLQPLFEALGDALVAIAPALGDLGRIFADSLTAVMPSLSLFIRELAEGLQPVLPVIADLLSAMFDALRPMIEPLAQVAVVVGEVLAEAFRALAPSLGPLAESFAGLVSAVAPLIPLIAESLSAVLIALAPALSDIFAALAPVIAQFADQMKPVIEQMAPILAEVAKTIGVALADAIRQIAPVLPDIVRAFSNLMLAVLPLLPELAKMAADLLPSLLRIFVELAPVTVKYMELLTWLAENILLPILIPALQNTARVAGFVFDVIGAGVGWMSDRITEAVDWLTETVFPGAGRGLERLRGWFDTGVDAIGEKWNQLKELVAVPVRFFVNTVWNDGLRKAWNQAADFLPGLEPMEPVVLGFAGGGAVFGPGTGTSDSIPAWLSTGEHIVKASEVLAAGGQNVWYAIRDMIARGVPFSWDGGRIVQDLGRENLDAYGAAVRAKGFGNVSPEGLFDPLLPRFREGGAVLPWMHQLRAGHEFARAQDGRPYQWAGPRFVGDSFDCSGFMGSIIAAILGGNPWQRYWATSSFAGYPQVGAQGLVKNLREGVGMLVGITDDPGGPGGGHTAGELRGIPELGIPAARVESGGALGNVHYGRGTPVDSFASLYGLPIGANGFFQPSTGGGSVGPSVPEQRNFVQRQIDRVFREITDPIRAEMQTAIGLPPPAIRAIPARGLEILQDKSAEHVADLVGGLGDLLPSAWQKAQELAGRAFEALTPFDAGGIATGVGFMPKNVLEPERVLDPTQTRLFETLVAALQRIAGLGSGATAVNSVAEQQQARQVEQTQQAIAEQGQTLAETRDLIERNESSQELVVANQTAQLQSALDGIAHQLGFDVLMPVVKSAMDSSINVVEDWLSGIGKQITAGTDRTTAAVQNLPSEGSTQTVPFGQPGSAFDAAAAISDAVVSVANTAAQTFQQVAQTVANAALAQKPSRVDESKGVLGKDISGGTLVDLIVKVTGAEIEVRDTLIETLEQIQGMRKDLIGTFDSSGRIVADTAELMQRNESSRDLVISEQNRINRELIKAVLRYLMTAVLIPILTAILGAMITLATTAIGAAIGSFIPVIGTAIGAAIGAVVGAALAGLASVMVAGLAIGAGAAIDSFDSGGVAIGKGLMPKDIVEPERVLSPRQTQLFDRMVTALESGQGRGVSTVNAPITYIGAGGPQAVQSHLLDLLN
jgi:phage-related protein